MAPSQSKTANGDDDYHVPRKSKAPPLTLIPEEKDDKEETCTFKLLSVPTVDTSAKYSFTMSILDGTGDVRAAIQYYRDIMKVFAGLNMAATAGNASNARSELAERMLRGTALSAYQKGMRDSMAANLVATRLAHIQGMVQCNTEADDAFAARQVTEGNAVVYHIHNEDVIAGIRAVITALTPNKALQRQKRWMRRNLRKTRDMTVRQFAAHLTRINDEELPFLPPNFANNQKLAEDEMIDILVTACPKKWSADGDRQNFDPLASGWNATVEFLTRQETAAEDDGYEQVKPAAVSKSSKKARSDSKSSSNYKSSGGSKYCAYHGNNPTHDSNNCRTLKKLADSAKKSSGGGGDSKNKTWSRKAQDGKDRAKKDLASFVRKTIRSELNAFSEKKRKSSDVEEGEIDNFDLAGFNYKEMDNLKIDSDDDSVSV